MSIISSLVHATFVYTKSASNLPVKKAHIFEFYAAYLGFKSYAAMSAEITNIWRLKSAIPEKDVGSRNLNSRVDQLGHPANVASIIAISIQTELQKLLVVPCDWSIVIDILDLAVGGNKSFTEVSKADKDAIFQNLIRQSDAGDPNAKLLNFLWQYKAFELLFERECNGGGDGSAFEASEYWYKQRLKGETLTNAQTEWADNFEKSQRWKTRYQQLMTDFPLQLLGRPNVKNVFESKTEMNLCWQLNARTILETLHSALTFEQRLHPNEDDGELEFDPVYNNFKKPISTLLTDWHLLATVQEPEVATLLCHFELGIDPFNSWVLYYTGLLHGIDLTEGAWTAGRESDSDWDDWDYESATESEFEDGVELENISDSDKIRVKDLANTIYKLSN